MGCKLTERQTLLHRTTIAVRRTLVCVNSRHLKRAYSEKFFRARICPKKINGDEEKNARRGFSINVRVKQSIFVVVTLEGFPRIRPNVQSWTLARGVHRQLQENRWHRAQVLRTYKPIVGINATLCYLSSSLLRLSPCV